MRTKLRELLVASHADVLLARHAILSNEGLLKRAVQNVDQSQNTSRSQSLNLDFGVPQGSCLGPLLFTIYASKLFDVIKVHLPTVHCYADDTQLYVSFSPNISTGQFEAVTAIQHCVDDIRNWMTNDKLLLNEDKTEFLMIGTKQQLAKVNIDHI